MLSPASLRVCCLAVMAPALTKADRQADCLPVGLSESFCVSKTADRFSGEGRNGELRFKSVYSSEYAQHRRRPLMQRAWWRTQKGGNRLFMKNRSESLETPSSLLYSSKIRAFRDARLKSWQNTNPTTAYAGKIKLKYTMNRNISNHKNMGLAKANTSLGLQSFKRAKQFSKENSNSGPNVMDDSLSFSDSADSSVQEKPLVSDAAATKTESANSPLDTNSSTHKLQEVDPTKGVSDKTDQQLVSKPVNSESLRSAVADHAEARDETRMSVALTGILSSTPETSAEPAASKAASEAKKLPDPAIDVFSVSMDETEMPASSLSPPSGSIDPDYSSSVDMNESVTGENLPASKFVVHDEKLGFASRSVRSKSLFSRWSCSKLLLNASKLHSGVDWEKFPVLKDNRFGLDCGASVRRGKLCCQPTKQELDSVQAMLAEKDKAVKTALARSSNLLRRQMCIYVRRQIGGLVEHYQRKFQIPCQRPTRFSNAKSEKELVDLKAELLQSEDVKSMSTAALVNLVRKLESSGSQPLQVVSPKALTAPPSVSSESETLDPEECEDIKDTSDLLLGSLKEVIKASDPYFTDTSDEEFSSETTDEEDEEMEAYPYYKSALYKYMTERAALASSSTWLLARNHELEYRIKEYDERWSEIVKAEGKVRLDKPPLSNSAEFSSVSAESDRAKRLGPKNFMPLNGCIDPGDSVYVPKPSTDKPAGVENPGGTDASLGERDRGELCSRTRPLDAKSFRKRKLAFIPGLHETCPKFSRLSSVGCQCNSQSDLAPCILCTGQYHSIQSVDPHSMALRDRISILEPYYHPALSTVKDIPLCFQLENYVKIDAAKHRSSQPIISMAEDEPLQQRPKFPEFRPQSKLSIYARSLSAKYRNKHRRPPGHFRRHKLVFGKWRRLHTRSALQARTRFRRRFTVASSDSSLDSPVHSPSSVFEDGFEKKREGNQFDIDNVIIPCNSRSGRLVEIQYKEIMIPNWRSTENDVLLIDHEENEEPENVSEAFLVKRHDALAVEEKERMKRSALGLSRRRRIRCDSRADSSGANTPDPTTLYNNQENVFRVPNFAGIENPVSPASPATPNSVVASDDSQSALGNGSGKSEPKAAKRSLDESSSFTQSTVEYDEVSPFEPLQFPLSDEVYEDLVAESDHNKEILEFPPFSPNYPPSPMSTTSSTSTVEEEEDDFSDPEWTVVRSNRNCPDQALVLKFAKR